MVDEPAKARPTKVGVLIVHGIGEQKRFDTSRTFTRSLATTLKARGQIVSVVDRSEGLSLDELACPSPDPDACPFKIIFKDGERPQSLHIHEVWWADIGKDKGFWADVKFWFWALGQWGAQFVTFTHFDHGLSNTDLLMIVPTFDPSGPTPIRDRLRNFYARFLLALWGFAAFLTFFSWSALKWVVSWISPYVGSPSIISDYVDRVRIYTQGVPPEGGSLVDIGRPWRATIRRRMVAELVAMAEREYDYWYVLAHSQGSVLAFNAMQEPEWSLPNHLEPRQFFRLRDGLRTYEPYCPPGISQKPDLTRMMPARPTWLLGDAGISRLAMFENFRGLVTYGSPLDKFAAIWPRIVCLNKQNYAFPKAQWVNLWDAHDPIGASLSAFSSGARKFSHPTNIHTKASRWFLLAHIKYFQPNSAEIIALLKVLFQSGQTPPSLHDAFNTISDENKPQAVRKFGALVQSLVLIAALSTLAGMLAYSASSLVGSLFQSILKSAPDVWPIQTLLQAVQGVGGWIASGVKFCIGDTLWSAVRFVWIVGATTVFICGVVRWIEEAGAMKFR